MPRAFKKRSRKNIKNKEPFTQRPNNFPHSKVEDFSVNWEAVLKQFDAKLEFLLSELSGSGSYITDRDQQLALIGSAIRNGDYNGLNLILQMENSLRTAANDIEIHTKQLQDIQNQLNMLDNSQDLSEISINF
tara:strand:- start:126 stop:524 length:399 start_codon:yes stop_codon:yes gene_type:complete